ncbi:MATE family efflux transporter [Haliscomenobacter hydrossis]|uniref:Multidrug-efflux transporter n=1 Tax=Haliscomenobacter hydrossis (strain ATCC 27775 / DSM 1100 / LMG 10767 / O) TaxID=760192 RepID=F4L4J6_HALH1|nr:MATE family efflux transporter [Haliscomenobacter hydrossis]AEE51997.1 MATE efflux family protein [Haliscomenobacter hydrossis DSM 1100]
MQSTLTVILDAIKGKERDYTTGGLNQALIILAIPMVIEMFMESLFALVDIFFVAKIGVEAVTTIGLTEAVLTLIYSVAIGCSSGATALVARRIGEKNPEAASFTAFQALMVGVSFGAITGIIGIFMAEDILRLMGATPEVIATGTNFVRIMLGSNVVIMLLFLLNGVFRGAGDPAIAMRTLLLANGLNIILDPIFIFGLGPIPAMGVTGAAVATTIGRSIGVMYQLYNMFWGKGAIQIGPKLMKIDWGIIRKLIEVSVSGAFQFIIASASWIFLMRIISRFGSESVAGYTIAIRVIIFALLPSWGLANAAATLVGQNLGANQPDRAEQSAWRAGYFNTIFLLVVSVLCITFAPLIMSFFTDIPLVTKIGVMTLRIFSIGNVMYAYGMVISQAFNGAGDTRTPMIVNFICFWLIEIPLGYFLAVTMGLEVMGICIAVPFSESLLAVILIVIFKKGKWKKVNV